MRILPRSPVEESALARGWAWLGFAVAGLAMAVYGGDFVVPGAAVAVAAAGHAASYRRRHRRRGFLEQAALAGLVVGCLAYFILDSVGAVFGGQLPQAHFAMFLVAVTSFDLRTRRNLYSSLWISLALLYLAAVYAWDYVFVAFTLCWTLCLVGFWASSHLAAIRVRPGLPARTAGAALAAAVAAGLGLFALLPQPTAHPDSPLVISLPSGAAFQGEMESPALPLVQFGNDSSGSTGSIDLRYRGRLGGDVVMYVRTGAPAYWRGLVFDRYANGQWTASVGAFQTFPPYVDQRHLEAPLGPQLGTFVQVFRPVRSIPGVIYAANPVEAIYFPAIEIRRDAYGAWRAPGVLRPGQTYSVVSSLPDWSAASLRAAAGDDDRTPAYLDTSGLSARARALAVEAVAGAAPDRYDQVLALTTYLQAHYQYSLELGHAPAGRDPIDWFLFDVRTGYCEQFASAATLMLRSLGIPARLATGYSTGDYDPVLNQAVVRERDAHAWVEAYFPGRGWVPVDPSPGYSAVAAARFPDRFAVSGLAHVIPHLTLGGPAVALTGVGLAALLPAVAAVLVAAVAGLVWLAARRRRRPVPRQQTELLRLYARAQRAAGRRRAPPETPREYAAVHAAVPGLPEVTSAVEGALYGGRWPDPGELAALRGKLRAKLSRNG